MSPRSSSVSSRRSRRWNANARIRQSETRYRALFQLSSEAVLIVDATTLKISEANPASVEMFSGNAKRLIGRNLMDMFHGEDASAAQRLLASVWSSPRAEDARRA